MLKHIIYRKCSISMINLRKDDKISQRVERDIRIFEVILKYFENYGI